MNNRVNLPFTTGVFPNIVKIAKIVPLYKNENKLECNNYRPISLLSSIGKLIEKLLHKRLYSFLNRESSFVLSITHGVSQGLVLGQLLFLIYISDLNYVVKHSAVRHFADDTNLLYSSSSLKSINKCINHDLKLIVHLLRGNRIYLNVDKTEIILIRPKSKTSSKNINFRISGQKAAPTTHTRYLGILVDHHLSWDQHLKMLKPKLNRANGLLAKVRY